MTSELMRPFFVRYSLYVFIVFIKGLKHEILGVVFFTNWQIYKLWLTFWGMYSFMESEKMMLTVDGPLLFRISNFEFRKISWWILYNILQLKTLSGVQHMESDHFQW